MGRSDDSSDDYYSRKSRKKKNKRRERSRSSSPGSDTSRQSSSRHKKSKKKHDRRHSPSPERRSRGGKRSRHRSRSVDSRSPSRSRSRYSRSRSRDRRSSRDRERRGRSGDRRLRSPERGARSGSTSHPDSRRSSVERHWESTRQNDSSSSSSANIKGLSLSDVNSSDMTASQLAEERMRQALRAAAAADEKLRLHSKLDVDGQSPLGQSRDQRFADRVKAIEDDKFVAATFSSSRDSKQVDFGEPNLSHDAAIFGSLASTGFVIKPDTDTGVLDWAVDNLMHPSLYCDPEEKMDRWMDRLTQLRKRKLEGEALHTS